METNTFFSAKRLAAIAIAVCTAIGFTSCSSDNEQTGEVPPPTSKNGEFTVNDNGLKVYFAPGNLQATYDGSNWTWAFAANQWEYIGGYDGNSPYHNNTGNNYINGIGTMSKNGTVDLFGWVGASCEWTGVAMYGISNATWGGRNQYGNKPVESLKSDWGNLITNSNTVWRTLTKDEWIYVLYRRRASTVNGISNACYTKATVVGNAGVILFPDSYIHPEDVKSPFNINAEEAAFTDNNYNAAAWGKLEAAGCAFLPAAGSRGGSYVIDHKDYPCGYYWSSTPDPGVLGRWGADMVHFDNNGLYASEYSSRYYGYSVRLVRQSK